MWRLSFLNDGCGYIYMCFCLMWWWSAMSGLVLYVLINPFRSLLSGGWVNSCRGVVRGLCFMGVLSER